MATKDRIYLVEESGCVPQLVRAHLCKELFQIKAASTEDVVNAMTQGIKVEDAKPDPDQAELSL